MALAVAMSAITYYLVEPHLRWGRHGGIKATGLLVTMITAGILGYEVYHHGGYKNRMPAPETTQAIADKINSLRAQGKENCRTVFPKCNNADDPFVGCNLQNKGDGNSIAVIGDSHARALYEGILAKGSSSDGAALFADHCAFPLLGAQSGYGLAWRPNNKDNQYNYKNIEAGFSYVLRHSRLKTVILTGWEGCFDHGGLADLSDPGLTDKRQILENATAKTFKTLTDAGKQVLFVFDVPTLATDSQYWDLKKLNECKNHLGAADASLGLRAKLMRQKDNRVEHACTFSRKDGGTYEAHAMIKEVVSAEAQKYKNVKTIDLSDLLCDDDGICTIQKDGNVLYNDTNHLSLNGVMYVAPEILKLLDDF